jgi:4a-hydroxytetrahydrobiopterin dehydratase
MAEDHVLTESEINEALAGLPGWEVRDNWLRRTFTTPGWPHTIMLVHEITNYRNGDDWEQEGKQRLDN